MKRYINHTKFEKHGGKTYPIGSYFSCNEKGQIYNNDGFMCLVSSQKSIDCLVGDDDGLGEQRGELVKRIHRILYNPFSEDHKEDQLEVLWNDTTALLYAIHKTPEDGAWLWNTEYYCAPINDLKHIYSILKEVYDRYEHISKGN